MQFKIKPPEGCKAKDIKIECEMTNDIIKTKLTYPNGFTVTSVICGDDQTITPSGELVDLGNGIYQVPN